MKPGLASGSTTAQLAPQLTFLLGARNSDGGWPFVSGGPSRREPTGRALALLFRFPHTAEVTLAAQAGLAFIQGRRQSDGLFLDEASLAYVGTTTGVERVTR